jgi:hypothetical protein
MKNQSAKDSLCQQQAPLVGRRQWLVQHGLGIGSLGLACLMQNQSTWAGESQASPLAPKTPHFEPKVKRVVHLFLSGGPSHLDLFDPKQELVRQDGKPHQEMRGLLYGSPFAFTRSGESGLEMSELLKKTSAHADKLCVIRSMKTDVPAHPVASRMLSTGHGQLARPSFGSWILYGLGAETENLPAFVVLGRGGNPPSSAFLPPVYQGTTLSMDRGEVMADLRNPALDSKQQRKQLDALATLNRQYQQMAPHEADLEARIQSFELAYQMQSAAPEAFDLSGESQSAMELYGTQMPLAKSLLATRRLLERGVRVVQVFDGGWDHHQGLITRIREKSAPLDHALSAFLTDLQRTGLLEDTLVIVAGEFGRTPTRQAGSEGEGAGRDHNHRGFSLMLAGGGIKGGHAHGATDDFGRSAEVDPVHVHDLHATMLHLLGFDHTRLTYPFNGRDYRLTDVYGRVVKEILS